MNSKTLRVLAFLLAISVCGLAQRGGGSAGGSRAPANRAGGSGNGIMNQQPNNTAGPTASQRSAHHAEDEKPVEFKSETVLIEVPTVVTDKSGAHVHGLSRTDFQILEDGKEQKIAFLQEIESSHAPLTQPAVQKGEYRNLESGEAPRTVTVIALDTVNTPFLDQAYARKQLIKYLAENVEPNQVLGLVAITSKGMKVLHGLTSDPALLVQALKKVNGEIPVMQGTDIDALASAATTDVSAPRPILQVNPANPGGDTESALQDFILNGDSTIARMQQDRAIEITMRGFLNIAWSLSGVPGRKSLVWATGGFPFYIDQPSAVPAGYLGVLYEEMMSALNHSEISIYPVDVRGLVNYATSATDVTSAPRGRSLLGPNFANSLNARSWLQTYTLDSLRNFAEMTGGRAFYNSNDIAGGFKRAADDSSSYYLLTYYLDTKNAKPGWRKLKVKVQRKDTEVRARTGFFVTNATMNPSADRQSSIAMAVQSPFESTGVPLQVNWQDITGTGDKKTVNFLLHVAANGFTVEESNKNAFDVDLVAVAMQDGKQTDDIGQTLQGSMPPEMLAKIQSGGLSYRNHLQLAAGNYTVRFVVRDNLSGKIGSVTAPLTVN